MRKLSLIFMAVLVAALAGCAGDTPTGNGDLVVVQDLQLDAASTGRTIVLVWTAVSDGIDGYRILFQSDGTGSFEQVGEVTTTTFTHTATVAGKYAVIAYKGDNTSSANSNEVTTMPTIYSGTFTIVDNNAPASQPSGFIFGGSSVGRTGMASEPTFVQDIYAYDDDFKGDTNVSLYSGNKGTFSNGRQSYFQQPASSGYGYCEPYGGSAIWYNTSYKLHTGDSVVFIGLTNGSSINGYAKMYGISVTPSGSSSPHGTEVTFGYEIQYGQQGAGNLTVFTSKAN